MMKKLVAALSAALLCALPAHSQVQNGPRFRNDGSITPPNASYNLNGVTGDITGRIAGATIPLPNTGAIARTLGDRLQDETNARDFCSPAISSNVAENPTLDATACLQAAVTAACAKTSKGGRLYVPAGNYYVGGTVNITCSGLEIAGAGVGDRYTATGTQITAGKRTGTNPVFLAQVGGFTNQAGQTNAPSPAIFSSGLSIHDLSFTNQGASVTNGRRGAMIDLRYWQQAAIYNVSMYAVCTAVTITGGFQISIENVYADNFEANCNTFNITGDTTRTYTTTDVVSFEKVKANAGEGGACYNITDRVQTVWWNNTTCQTGGAAIRATCPTMSSSLFCPGFFTLHDFEAEYHGTSGGNLIQLTDVVNGFKMTNSWLRGVNGSNVVNNFISVDRSRFTTAGNLMVSVSDTWMKGAGGDCIYINSPSSVNISNNQIYGCNFFNAGAAGVTLAQGRGTVTGNTFCGDDWLNSVNWQMAAGVKILPGIDYTAVTGNVFSGSVNSQNNACQTGVANSSSGTRNVASANAGPA